MHVIECTVFFFWDDILADLFFSSNAAGKSLVMLALIYRGVGDEKTAVCFRYDGV